MKSIYYLAATIVVIGSIVLGLVAIFQRRLLYFPTHYDTKEITARLGLTRWEIEGDYTGYARVLKEAPRIWFFVHGNGGQAGNRDYVLERIGPRDSVYILEYPGYGERGGSPSKSSLDAGASKAYRWLVQKYGVDHLVVLGESLGSGPVSLLAKESVPPKHIVLVVPFDILKDVAQEAFPILPVGMLMLDRWNNCDALKGYTGRLDIFGAKHDQVIPVHHARKLAASLPHANYQEFDGGHGWASRGLVDLSRL